MATEQQQQQQLNNSSDSPSPSPSASLTLRMIMQGKEAGSIIGKKGDNVKKYREDSGAKINISDSSCPERIVTVTGTTQNIHRAFSMICKKFEEDIQNLPPSGAPKPPVTVRLVVPASQCGSLIGKGGAKIKDIREITGASIQVASEMLPNSTERTVTISGTADAITDSVYHICCVMLESPPKGATIPYRPKPMVPPVIMAGGQAFALQGQYTLPQPDLTKLALQQGMIPTTIPYVNAQGVLPGAMPGAIPGFPGGRHNHMAATAPAAPNHTQQTHEITIPNDLIGCIIGRGGSKINEIRQMSGATIKIANADEGCSDRKVTITGTPETINAAQYLINASMEMHKMSLTLENAASLNNGVGVAGVAAATVTGAPATSLATSPVASSTSLGGSGAAATNPAALTVSPAPSPQAHLSALQLHHHQQHAQLLNPLPLFGLNMNLLDVNLNRKMLQHQAKLKTPSGGTASLVAAGNHTGAVASAVAAGTPSLVKKVDRVKFAPY